MAGQSYGRSVYGVASYSRLRRLSQPPDKVLFLKPNTPTGIRETAWRLAGADLGITIDSILIVESNRALGLAPWGVAAAPMERFSSKEGFKTTFTHDRKDHQEGRHSL